MNYVNGKIEPKTLKNFWDMWTNDLKGSFPKKDVIESLSTRWEITERNVYARLTKETIPFTVQEMSWLYSKYFIGFNYEKGFFFDDEKERIAELNEAMEDAMILNMSK